MSDVDFKQALADAGIPTTEVGLLQAWEKEVAAGQQDFATDQADAPFAGAEAQVHRAVAVEVHGQRD